jgi:hypothetical protein
MPLSDHGWKRSVREVSVYSTVDPELSRQAAR